MAGKKTGKRLLTWVLVLVMALSLLPLNALAASPAVMRIVKPDTDKCITYEFYNDEAKVDEQIIKTGDTLREPEVTVQDGKRLTGWYTENDTLFDGFGEYTETIEKNSTVKLYAKFEDVYYVFFKDTTDRIVATKEGVTGAKIKFDDVSFPVESDESITGWYLEGDQDKTAVTSVTLESTNVTLCAIVEKGHWITFDSDGGSYVEPLFVPMGKNYAAPTAPTKPGYDFAGWYKDGTKFTFDSSLTENLTLTAHWTEKKDVQYTVIHWLENADDNNYSYKESETKTGTAGAQTNATAKSYKGFTAQTITQETIKGDGSTIVNVRYTRNEYTITFYLDNPIYTCGKEAHSHSWRNGCYNRNGELTCTKEEHTHTSACTVFELTITAKYGANISDQWPTVNGSSTWRTKESFGLLESPTYQVNIDTMPLNGSKFYGPETGYGSETAYYYVEVLPGETGTNYNGTTYKLHHSDTSPGTGYRVSEEDKYPITGFTYKEGSRNGSRYNEAKFYYTRNSYDIVYVNTGAEDDKTVSYKFEAPISDARNYEPTTAPAGKEGYEFAGWYADPAGEQEYVFTGKTMPAQNITVYAKWKAPTFTVTVHDSDKKVLTTISNVPLRGTINKADMPTVSLAEGDTFLGWTYEDGTPFNFNTAITKNIDLYARVGNKAGYSVTYVTAEGSSLVTDDKLYAEGAYATVRDGASTAPAGKVFLYWNASSDSSGKKYYPNDKVLVPKGGVTLMAVYGNQSETVTLTYHANYPEGSNPADQSYSYNNNERITVKANMFPVPTGYVFDKWTTAQNGGDTYNPDAPARVDSEGSNDLYARWTPNTDTRYTVEYYYQNTDDTYPAMASKAFNRTGTTGTIANVTADDKADKEKGKYTYDSTAANKVESGTIAADGSLKLKLYFKLSKIDYTIEYYYEGQSTPFDKTTANVTYGTEVSEVNDSSNLKPHYSRTSVDPNLPVQINKAGIVIKVTYAKDPVGDGTFDFNDVDHSDDKATPAITKTVKGNVGRNFKETFKVAVEPKSDNAKNTMTPASYTGEAKVTYSNRKDIAFQFNENDKLTFRNKGKYIYTVREEIPGKTSRMSYDTTEYTLTIMVALDEDTNTYQVESWQFTAGNRENLTQLNIVNTYRTYHPSTPSKPTLNTGDHYAYVMGYPDGTVRPNGSITRAEVSAILFRLLSDKTRDEYFTTESSFTDVKAGAWYNNSIATLEKAGVIVDTAKGGAFRPNEAITRAELAAMLAQFSDAKPVKGVKFSDVPAEHWAYEAIAIAAKMGWIEGYPDGTFRPDATITRAEMMTLVNRALERVPSDEDHLLSKRVMLTFPDCKSGDWFYIAVQEATNSHTYERAATEKNGDEQWTALRANRDWTLLEK